MVAVEVIMMYKAKNDEFKLGMYSGILLNLPKVVADTKKKQTVYIENKQINFLMTVSDQLSLSQLFSDTLL